jgi:hypothetical protein
LIVLTIIAAHDKKISSIFRNKDDVLSLFVHLGYLSYRAKSRTVWIPNLEIRKEFKDTLEMSSHRETARLIMETDQLIENTQD